jgi:hypothetical protein
VHCTLKLDTRRPGISCAHDGTHCRTSGLFRLHGGLNGTSVSSRELQRWHSWNQAANIHHTATYSSYGNKCYIIKFIIHHASSYFTGIHVSFMISGLLRDVHDICALLGYYAASSGNPLPTFWGNVSVSSSRDKMGPIRSPETWVNNYHSTLRNIPEERRSHVSFHYLAH